MRIRLVYVFETNRIQTCAKRKRIVFDSESNRVPIVHDSYAILMKPNLIVNESEKNRIPIVHDSYTTLPLMESNRIRFVNESYTIRNRIEPNRIPTVSDAYTTIYDLYTIVYDSVTNGIPRYTNRIQLAYDGMGYVYDSKTFLKRIESHGNRAGRGPLLDHGHVHDQCHVPGNGQTTVNATAMAKALAAGGAGSAA